MALAFFVLLILSRKFFVANEFLHCLPEVEPGAP
jgi:hypothetical protein